MNQYRRIARCCLGPGVKTAKGRVCWRLAQVIGLLAALGSARAQEASRLAPCGSPATCQAECMQGSATGCVRLADQLDRGTDPPVKDESAALQKACELGDPDGCSALALALQQGDGIEQDKQRSAALLQEALRLARLRCARGDAAHCVRAAVLLREAGQSTAAAVQALLRKAAELKEVACKRSEPGACVAAANAFAYAVGVPEDRSRALRLVKSACARREARACHKLGVLLANADRDRWCEHYGREAGRDALQAACELGNSEGCQLLADHPLLSAAEKARVRARVAMLRRAACEQGDFASCLREEPAGAKRLTSACEKDSAAACAALGGSYLSRACHLGDIAACAELACDRQTQDAPAVQRTVRLSSRACLRGDATACARLGTQLGSDCAGADQSGVRAFFYEETACLLGDVAACNNASIYSAAPQLRYRAEQIERRACELGSLAACNRISSTEQPPAWMKDAARYCK